MAQQLAGIPQPQITDQQDGAPADDDLDQTDGQQEPAPEAADGEDDVEDPDGADDLGDPGKKALDRMKATVREERRQRREIQAQLDKLQREREAADKSPDEQAIDKARAEARAEATEKANARILRSEVRAAAAGKFRDPSDALAFLDLTEFEVSEDGDVDADELSEALDDLLQRKPHLAAQSGTTSFDSARGKPAPKKKLTKEDLSSMTPAQIAKAYDEGRVAV